jgi:hypothetical protein
MKKTLFSLLIGLGALIIFVPAYSANDLVIYNAPDELVYPNGDQRAPEYSLKVNGKSVYVYNTKSAAFAYFSFEGKVEIQVMFGSSNWEGMNELPIYNFNIRPSNLKIDAKVYRNLIIFDLDNPANISVEINKNIKRPLLIFANPLEKDIPDKSDKSVIFYEKGKIHTPGIVNVKSNQTVYIEGGAIVRGSFIVNGSNIKIRGRGIIDNGNGLYEHGKGRPIDIKNSRNILLEGIIISESQHWCCGAYASRDVEYRNIKIVSDIAWDDGIDIVGSQNILIDNCFIKTFDDCVAIKSGEKSFYEGFGFGNVNNIMVQNSVIWNGSGGNGLEIGFETQADTIKNITFKNIDIIHVEGTYGGVFTIHNGDRAVVQNVLYEDIRVEDARGWLIDFRILNSIYSKDQERGFIESIRFKNIIVEGDYFPPSQLLGFNEKHLIKDILCEGLVIHGRKIYNTTNGMMASIHIEGLSFK